MLCCLNFQTTKGENKSVERSKGYNTASFDSKPQEANSDCVDNIANSNKNKSSSSLDSELELNRTLMNLKAMIDGNDVGKSKQVS